jgi:hypothetical protein
MNGAQRTRSSQFAFPIIRTFFEKSSPQKRPFCAFLYQNLPRPFGISNAANQAGGGGEEEYYSKGYIRRRR